MKLNEYLLKCTVAYNIREHYHYKQSNFLTLSMLNFLNGIIHLPFLALSIIILRDIKMRTWSLSANSIEHGQTAEWCAGWPGSAIGKDLSLSVPEG